MQTPETTAAAGQPADLPIPAPARRATQRPTDAPVLAALPDGCRWDAMRFHNYGQWHLAKFDRHFRIVEQLRCVVDDQGTLVTLSADQDTTSLEYWWSTFAIDEAACDWAQTQAAAAETAAQQQRQDQRTRDLLQPPRITAEIATEPADYPGCAASLLISGDPRLDVPTYCLQIGLEERVIVTEVQLAALAMAIGQLLPAAVGKRARAH